MKTSICRLRRSVVKVVNLWILQRFGVHFMNYAFPTRRRIELLLEEFPEATASLQVNKSYD